MNWKTLRAALGAAIVGMALAGVASATLIIGVSPFFR